MILIIILMWLKIENTFKSDEFFRVIFHFDNIQKNNTQIGNSQIDSACLKKLPWHLWDLFENRENTYFVLSLQDTPANPPLRYPVRILAVFGGSDEGLKLKEDKHLLNSLRAKGAEVAQITKLLGKYIFRTSANDMVAIDTLFDYWKKTLIKICYCL